ncbi:hypothetical protein [Micromonospora sp. NPDC047730]|uniref:hypothetical protein n=1 Tax=Micromonospora sp. NPDC047730 TaxID=3364253 RepID=UPI003712E881
MTAGTGLMVALGYMEQPRPLNEALLGAIGGGHDGDGVPSLEEAPFVGLGAHTGHKTA